MSDNYEKQVMISRGLFLNYDQDKMIHKFHLQADETYIYMTLLGREYRIRRSDGAVLTEEGECLDFSTTLTIYDVLCCSAEQPMLAHEWSVVGNLQRLSSSPGTDTFTGKYAALFSGRAEQLQMACQQIGGRQPAITAGADVCWEFDLFPFLPVQFRFWDGDDEFPPQIKLLWDKNTLDFMHFETTYYAQGLLLSLLREKMGSSRVYK